MAITRALRATARAAGRALKALLAAAVTLGVLAGIPWALAHYAGDPLPASVPTLTAAHHALTSAMTPQTLLKCLSIAGWYLWLILALSFAVELAAAVRRVNAPHIPTLGPTQALAAALIAAIGITALARPATASAAETTATPTGARVAATAPAAVPVSLAAAHARLAADTGTARESVHTVVTGDSLYSIAKQDLGDGDAWPALYKLNADKPQPDGQELTNPDLIRPGWSIRITAPAANQAPAATPAPPSETHPATPTPHTSAPHASTAQSAPAPATAAHANSSPDSKRTDPPAPSVHAAAPARRHGGVAVDLPDGGTIGITLAVALGSALVLARRWRTRRADPNTPDREPHLPGALLAARRAHLAASATATSAQTSAGKETATTITAPHQAVMKRDGTAIATVLRAEGGSAGLEDDEADAYFDPEPALETPDATLQDEADGFEEEALEQDPPAGYDGPAPVAVTAPMKPGSISTAERGGAEIPLHPTGAGLGLIGPGAAGAARAIAASVLSAGAPDRTADLARLIIPAADLGILLGVEEGDLPAIAAAVPELFITDDLPAALAEAEVNALLRTRLLEEAEADDLDQLEREHPDVEECPPLVVMASPQRAETGRIGALIDQSARLRITTVTLGAHPRAATVYVGADGHTEGPDLAEWTGARMFNLPAAAFTDVLHLLAAAAGHLPTPEPDPRPDLTLVHDGEPQPTDQVETPDTDAAHLAATVNPDRAAAQTGRTDTPAAPHLVLVDDPAETRAQQALAAWDEHPVRISVLGPLLIEADGELVAKLRSQARPIAALLAWKGPSGASDQQIDATCWPDEDDPARIQQWRQDGLKSLRSRLRLTTGRKTAPFIARDHRGYLLEPAFTTVDLWVLQALEAAASATRDPQAKARYLTRAAEFCTGTLLAEESGPDFAWADGPRVTVTGLQVSVLARLAELVADDEPDKALTALRRAAAMAEDNEHLHLRIIDLLAAQGRHAEIPAQMQILTAHADSMGASVSQAARAHAARAMRTADARP